MIIREAKREVAELHPLKVYPHILNSVECDQTVLHPREQSDQGVRQCFR